MTQTRKRAPRKQSGQDRVVYEVRSSAGVKQVNAASTAELKVALSPLLQLDPYAVQATAHLVHAERVAVQGQGWSVRRVGVLSFQPDAPEETPKRTRKPAVAAPPAAGSEAVPVTEIDRVWDSYIQP